ncbi:MAG: SNF2-related protein [Sedimentisphaeraceae bacterium JB056]
MTDYHAKYFAHQLSLTGGTGGGRLDQALFNACVELNPHQIEASLFALHSPVSQGVMLADEVGLGKTIEAGLVLCQYWAEHRRKILVISPASLRKQWGLELNEKFNLPSIILDSKIARKAINSGIINPFDTDKIIICSMHFAASNADFIQQIPWDMVVIDEAHKLRNAYRNSNRIGQSIRRATNGRKKMLLTATPLQNSLLELYGLSTLIDENLFGDLASFRSQYTTVSSDLDDLRDRFRSICWRSLRKDVASFTRYTERKLITRPFKPSEQEYKLYKYVSDYLQRKDNYALPSGQRHLITLIVRKVLASSPYAVAGTLETIKERLIRLRADFRKNSKALDRIILDEELDEDLLDEILEDQEDSISDTEYPENQLETENIDPRKLDKEIAELGDYIRWTRSIGVDTKTRSLLKALEVGFDEMAKMGAAKKAVVFTESRRSQEYLRNHLESNGYMGKVYTFNGTNRDQLTTQIYKNWLEENQETGRISGSRAIDIRTAITDKFKQSDGVLIATEAAAEGINLQFCSLVINYDLPWNPQRIEQRIGRCHRYGQKHDVVVINFLNERNEADRRVYELLKYKFNLFTGVFGASDEVLGAIESGVDFERRILEIYQQCRSEEEIELAFDLLQKELEDEISLRMSDTRKKLLENFDEDVHDRLKVNLKGTKQRLDKIAAMFWRLTKIFLKNKGVFDDRNLFFDLQIPPESRFPRGRYHLISKEANRENVGSSFLYRLSHPLGEYIIDQCKQLPCNTAELIFDTGSYEAKISVVEKLKGKSGWLRLIKLEIESFEKQDYLLFSAFDQSGKNIDQETVEKFFSYPAKEAKLILPDNAILKRLDEDSQRYIQATIAANLEQNNAHFIEARDQLDKWADDKELALQKQLDDMKKQIRAFQRQSRQAPTMAEQKELQEKIAELERKKRRLRQNIFDLEDQIAQKRDNLIDALEKRMQQKTKTTQLFTVKWKVI